MLQERGPQGHGLAARHAGELRHEFATSLVNLGDNYWDDWAVNAFDPAPLLGAMSSDMARIATMLEHLESGEYGFTLANAQSGEEIKN